MDNFIASEKYKKLTSVYYPVDKTVMKRYKGLLPPICPNSFIQNSPIADNKIKQNKYGNK